MPSLRRSILNLTRLKTKTLGRKTASTERKRIAGHLNKQRLSIRQLESRGCFK